MEPGKGTRGRASGSIGLKRVTLHPLSLSLSTPSAFDQTDIDHRKKRLKLSTLELERIYLSIPVLSRSVDWSRLESLTLLGSTNH